MLRRGLILVPLLAAALAAQTPKPQFTFSANTRLVVEAVSVTDKQGRPVEGLTAKDFHITEDGVAQTVAFAQFQKLDDAAAAAAEAAVSAPAAAPGPPHITPEAPGHTPYAGHRLVALYFDMADMPVADQLRALAAARRFLGTQMHPADLVAILSYSGTGVQVQQDFSGDRDTLLGAVNRMIVGISLGMNSSDSDAASADTGSAFGQDDSEFNVFRTNRQLAALHTAIDMLAPISEKKSLVYFTSGLNLRVDNQAQLESTTNQAIRDNVGLYPVDARGQVASAPLGDASQGSPGGVAMYNGGAAGAFDLRRERTQDTLYALGDDTGGRALLDNNDLSLGIERARDAIGSYYILGYYTSNAARDGKYRKVEVTLAPPRPGAKLGYRTGYYADKTFDKFTTADKERQLEDALLLGNPITDLTLALEVNYFQLNSAEYFVPIAAKIPGRELALAKQGGAEHTLLDFIGEVKDPYGTTITNLRDRVDAPLQKETVAQLARVPVEYTAGFTLLPGEYSLKLLARDNETGRIGTYLKGFSIPNLARQTAGLPISSVVLGAQRVPVSTAAYQAGKDKDLAAATTAANPLIRNGSQLLPSVSRVFQRGQRLYVYLQAYEHGATAMRPLEAYVGFYQADKKVWEAPPRAITTGMNGRAQAVPIPLGLPLEKLAPGTYICQVTVLDPGAQLANFWRGEITIR